MQDLPCRRAPETCASQSDLRANGMKSHRGGRRETTHLPHRATPVRDSRAPDSLQCERLGTCEWHSGDDHANATGSKMLFQIHKVTVDEDYAVAKLCEPFSTGCNGHRITVNPDKPAGRTARLKKFNGMPTITHRTVKIGSAIL